MKKKWSPPAIVLILIGICLIVLQGKLQLPLMALFILSGFLCVLVGVVLSLIAIIRGEAMIFVFFILALVLLLFTKPSEKAFTQWLFNKHSYDCGPTECIHYYERNTTVNGRTETVPTKEIIKIVQQSSKDYIFFTKSSLKTMDEQGRLFLIEGRGILGMYYTATFKPVYE